MKTLLVFAVAVVCLSVSVPAQQEPVDQQHEKEEAAVNPYTEPEVDEIFKQLEDVKPLPYEQLQRDSPQTFPGPGEQLGLVFGTLIADGFLIVSAERKDRVDDLGRVLLRQAKSLGVGDRVIRHSASLTELGKKGDWPAVRKELIATQQDVEDAMVQLRDQKLAHLISLGGWLRGLEICAGAVEDKYTPDRSAVLWQRDLVNYFAEEMETLPPTTAHKPLFEKVRKGLG